MKQAVFVDPDGMALIHAPSGALLVPDFPLRERAFASEVNCPQRLRIVALLWNLRTTGLAERFHELVGVTPMHYITTWRMRNARELLMHSHLGIKEVAERTGYSSAASFSRAYKRFFGDTPRAPAQSEDVSRPPPSLGKNGNS